MKNILKRIKRISAILLAILLLITVTPMSFVSAAASGKTYYVSADGSDTSDGLKESNPMSLYKANATLLKGGDKILFKRGDIFYGIFSPIVGSTDNESRVEVGAYGEGDLPILSMAKIVNKPWENAGDGFYKMDLSNDENYSGIRNKAVASKDIANVGFFETTDGKIHGERKKDAASCKKQYDFYCDDTAIYIKTDKDPFVDFGELTLAIHGCIIRLNRGVNVRNLHLQHSGYGICWKSGLSEADAKFSDITDCVIEKLGGTVIDVQNFTRAGNGIELYDRGESVVIKNNIFRYIFDVAFTCQGNTPGKWRNITISDNVFAYNTQAMEFWCASNAGIYSLVFENNLCIKNGESWASLGGTPRLNSTDILVYGFQAPSWQVTIKNNTFYHSTGENDTIYYVSAKTISKFLKNIKSDNNYIYHVNDKSRVFVSDDSTPAPAEYRNMVLNINEWLKFSDMDKNSVFTSIENNLDDYKSLEELATVSMSYDEIVKAAKDSGLTVTASFTDAFKPNDGGNSVDKKPATNKTDVKESKVNIEIPERVWLYVTILGAAVLVFITVAVIITVISIKDKKRMANK